VSEPADDRLVRERNVWNDTEMKEYVTTCVIDAAPEAVWKVLTDADGYAQWNPEIVGIAGQLVSGGRITARVRLGDGATRSVTMRVTALDAPTRMEWVGGMPLGLFIGRRTFTVTPSARGSEFRLHLQMSGALSSLIIKSVGDRQPEIDSFAAALKARAERR
jgi:uncharacterized protein YndB with AHSA1/START domain